MDDKPGEPRPSPQEVPKPVQTKGDVSFSYLELELMSVQKDDNITYLIFMVRGEFMIQIKKSEYFEYLDFIMEETCFLQEDGATCTCDICIPEYELVDSNVKVNAVKIDVDTKEELEKEDKFISLYLVYDLPAFTVLNIHDNHENKD